MSAVWKHKIPLECGDGQDGAEIYDIVENFAKFNNVIWDGDDYKAKTIYVFEGEAYIVPHKKLSRFVRYVCDWFAEAITGHAADEEGGCIASTLVEVRSRHAVCRNTFELTVSWRGYKYTIQQFLIPCSGDEAFHGWDSGDKDEEGGAK